MNRLSFRGSLKAACLLALSAFAGVCAKADTLYGVGDMAGVSGSVLLTIDSSTGKATRVGNSTVPYASGLTMGIDGFLYLANGPQLYKIDPGTAAMTFIGQMPDYVNAIGFSSNGKFYGLNSNYFSLYEIDPQTGAQISAKFVSTKNLNDSAYFQSFLSNPDGTFLGLSPYPQTLNPTTGQISGTNSYQGFSTSNGYIYSYSLARDSQGNIYTEYRGQGFSTLYLLDLDTSTATAIGNSTASPPALYVQALASAAPSPVPVPGAAWLLMSGVGVLAAIRKRRLAAA